jgi:hypothetical protein
VARTTISIADDLKRRMDRVRKPVNWSSVAAEAFERRLNVMAQNKQEKSSMEAVIARLRASRDQRGLDEFALGEARGSEWAMKIAEYAELSRLEKHFDVTDMLEHYNDRTKSVFSWAERLAFTTLPMRPLGQYTSQDAAKFWARAGVLEPRHLQSAEFLRGFVEGAVSIFEQVKSAL